MKAVQPKVRNPSLLHKTSGVHRRANLMLRLETIVNSARNGGIGKRFERRVKHLENRGYVPLQPQIPGVPENSA